MGIYLYFGDNDLNWGKRMGYVVKADDRGRIKLPKEMFSPGDRVLVLPAGRRVILIRVPPRPLEASSSWLRTEKSREELRALAESRALEEVGEKLGRKSLADRD